MRTRWCVALLAVLVGPAVPGRIDAQDRPALHVSRATVPPKIDGVLDDPAWRGEPLTLGHGCPTTRCAANPAPERTEVRITYDERFVYFAFHCLTDDPTSVRTTVSKRDNVFNDDWIGFSLDSTGARQTAYHLMVNPSGVQMDAVNTSASGEKFDTDFVWYSAGARTADGYVVELALPLQTIRFSKGPAVTMGMLFWRHVSQAGVSYSWPDMPPGTVGVRPSRAVGVRRAHAAAPGRTAPERDLADGTSTDGAGHVERCESDTPKRV